MKTNDEILLKYVSGNNFNVRVCDWQWFQTHQSTRWYSVDALTPVDLRNLIQMIYMCTFNKYV